MIVLDVFLCEYVKNQVRDIYKLKSKKKYILLTYSSFGMLFWFTHCFHLKNVKKCHISFFSATKNNSYIFVHAAREYSIFFGIFQVKGAFTRSKKGLKEEFCSTAPLRSWLPLQGPRGGRVIKILVNRSFLTGKTDIFFFTCIIFMQSKVHYYFASYPEWDFSIYSSALIKYLFANCTWKYRKLQLRKMRGMPQTRNNKYIHDIL